MKQDMFQILKKQAFVHVPFFLNSKILERAVEAFFKFLEEPDEIKNHIDFKISIKHRRGDVGFKHRNPEEGRLYTDSKDFFHFHPEIFKRYEEFLKENPVVLDFMEKARPIWDLTYQTVYEILESLDKIYPNTLEKIFDKKYPHIMVRFLKYNWQESGKYLAKPHFDCGSFTLAIAESGPGLRIGSCPETLQLIENKEGEAVFMFSSNFKQVLDAEEFSAGWHDVIQIDETIIGQPFSRWAVVAFIEADVEALSREETHKWYREESK